MTKNDRDKKERAMTADQIDTLFMEFDNPSADPFELSRKLEKMVIASDNKLSHVDQHTRIKNKAKS